MSETEAEKKLRNKLAQAKHREKRKQAERENMMLKQRVRELEAKVARMERGNNGGDSIDEARAEKQHQHQQHHCCQKNLTKRPESLPPPQYRLSRKMSVSNTSISSQSSVFSLSSNSSVCSNYDDYSPNYREEDYIPNYELFDKNLDISPGSCGILAEYLDFGIDNQNSGNNPSNNMVTIADNINNANFVELNSVQQQEARMHSEANIPHQQSNNSASQHQQHRQQQQAQSQLMLYDDERGEDNDDLDLITPLASAARFAHSHEHQHYSYPMLVDDPELVTPRPHHRAESQ